MKFFVLTLSLILWFTLVIANPAWEERKARTVTQVLLAISDLVKKAPPGAFKKDFNRNLDMKTLLFNDSAQAIGDKIITMFEAEFKKGFGKEEFGGFRIIYFQGKFINDNTQTQITSDKENGNIQRSFENSVLKYVLAVGPVFGIGTSIHKVYQEKTGAEPEGTWFYRLITFATGSEILDLLDEMLAVERMTMSVSATARAIEYRRQCNKISTDEQPESSKCKVKVPVYYPTDFVLFKTEVKKPVNAENSILEAIQNMYAKKKSKTNTFRELITYLDDIVEEYDINEGKFKQAKHISYGFTVWQKKECDIAYMAIFFEFDGAKEDIYGIPSRRNPGIHIPQTIIPAKIDDEPGDAGKGKAVRGPELGEEEGEGGDEEDDEEEEQEEEERRQKKEIKKTEGPPEETSKQPPSAIHEEQSEDVENEDRDKRSLCKNSQGEDEGEEEEEEEEDSTTDPRPRDENGELIDVEEGECEEDKSPPSSPTPPAKNSPITPPALSPSDENNQVTHPNKIKRSVSSPPAVMSNIYSTKPTETPDSGNPSPTSSTVVQNRSPPPMSLIKSPSAPLTTKEILQATSPKGSEIQRMPTSTPKEGNSQKSVLNQDIRQFISPKKFDQAVIQDRTQAQLKANEKSVADFEIKKPIAEPNRAHQATTICANINTKRRNSNDIHLIGLSKDDRILARNESAVALAKETVFSYLEKTLPPGGLAILWDGGKHNSRRILLFTTEDTEDPEDLIRFGENATAVLKPVQCTKNKNDIYLETKEIFNIFRRGLRGIGAAVAKRQGNRVLVGVVLVPTDFVE